MSVEEAGHEMPPAQVQHMRAFGRRVGTDGFDEPVAHDHHGVFEDAAVHDVHHLGVHERHVGLRQDGVIVGEVGDGGLSGAASGGEENERGGGNSG